MVSLVRGETVTRDEWETIKPRKITDPDEIDRSPIEPWYSELDRPTYDDDEVDDAE